MSYDKVSELLEGAKTDEEIQNRLNSLSSVRQKKKTQILLEGTQTSSPNRKKLSGLASIVAKV